MSAPADSALVRVGDRLALYQQGAETPEFWERQWERSPPLRMRGQAIHPYFRAAFLRWLPKGELIVEAGCGNGCVLRTMVNAGYEVEGLDFAARAIGANRAIDPGGRYRVGDVRAMPYADGSLGGYVSLGVVEHFPDDERRTILKEAARCLRTGGVAIITTPYFSPALRAREAMGAFDGGARGLEFYQFYFTRRDLVGQVEGAGMRVVAVDGYDVQKGARSGLGLTKGAVEWMKRWGPGRRVMDDPPAWVRWLCGHMVMVVARKRA